MIEQEIELGRDLHVHPVNPVILSKTAFLLITRLLNPAFLQSRWKRCRQTEPARAGALLSRERPRCASSDRRWLELCLRSKTDRRYPPPVGPTFIFDDVET